MCVAGFVLAPGVLEHRVGAKSSQLPRLNFRDLRKSPHDPDTVSLVFTSPAESQRANARGERGNQASQCGSGANRCDLSGVAQSLSASPTANPVGTEERGSDRCHSSDPSMSMRGSRYLPQMSLSSSPIAALSWLFGMSETRCSWRMTRDGRSHWPCQDGAAGAASTFASSAPRRNEPRLSALSGRELACARRWMSRLRATLPGE